MALTNTPAYPNKILNQFGSINSWEPNFVPIPLAGNINIGLAARSLIIKLTGEIGATIKSIDYNVNVRTFTGTSTSISRIIGRLAVFRNYNGELANMIFDPLFSSKSTTGNFSGINWRTQAGINIPIFDWDSPDVLLHRFIGGSDYQQSDSIPFDWKIENENENIVVVLTPFYGDIFPNSTGGAVDDFAGIHTFLGSQPPTSSFSEAFFVFRSLSVLGKLGDCGC